jgi:hypothetical protein
MFFFAKKQYYMLNAIYFFAKKQYYMLKCKIYKLVIGRLYKTAIKFE